MTRRERPYSAFNFLVSFDHGDAVAGVTKVSGLRQETEVVPYRSGGERDQGRLVPGATRYEPITLERGITHDPTFVEWALVARDPGETYRRNLVIELLDEEDEVVVRYLVKGAWVSHFTALPELDANSNAVAIETITVQHEGFERDPGVDQR